MTVLVINCGSTSIKADVIDEKSGQRYAKFRVQRIGTDAASATLNGSSIRGNLKSHGDALSELIPKLLNCLPSGETISSVGHRVVHGGQLFQEPTLLTDEVVQSLQETIPLAPLHNPAAIAGMKATRELLNSVPQVAVFDTAFHRTITPRAATYALPAELTQKHGLRKYGFHGTSHQYVSDLVADHLQDDVRNLRIITCHLGGGCSVCAVEFGRSIETSMGLTPLEGLVMATRCGDIDPAVLLHIMRAEGFKADQLDTILNRESGLKGLSGVSGDFRDLEKRSEEGDENCRAAIDVFCHRVRKYIGAYAAVMGGVDAIVFTAGIGANSALARHHIAQRLEFLGARLDERLNRKASVSAEAPIAEISQQHSRVKIFAAQTDEAWQIARQAKAMSVDVTPPKGDDRTIPVAISARHIHLTQETVEQLFGQGHELTPLKPLSQPGQFAAKEQVELVGPKRSIQRVRVLGPVRSKNQVEISRTDEFHLGIDAPIRASGDVTNSPGITLIGTEGRQVTLDQGVICAWRHIHMTPDDAQYFGVNDRDVVEVEVGKEGVRSLTFGDVLVRVKSSYKLEMHIDTDEGNAAELDRQDVGKLESGDITQTVGIAKHLKKKNSN